MPDFDKDLCNGCSICVEVCPARLIRVEGELAELPADKEAMCLQCGHCAAYCPQLAVTVDYPGSRAYAGISPSPAITLEQMGYHLASRRSVRNFKTNPVERDTIERLMDMVRYAPTGSNSQTVEWIIVSSRDKLDALSHIIGNRLEALLSGVMEPRSGDYLSYFLNEWKKGRDIFLRRAPHLAVAHQPVQRGMVPIDAVIAASYFDVAAPALGIGTCWAGLFQMAASATGEIHHLLNIPEGYAIGGALMFGYPRYQISGIPVRNESKVLWM